jgi:hypothetical protein
MTDMSPAPAGIRIGHVLGRSFSLLGGNFVKLYLLALLILSPFLLFALVPALDTAGNLRLITGNAWIGFILFLVLSLLGQAVILYGALQTMRGEAFSIGASLNRGLGRFFPILGLFICMGAGIGVGLILLIIPGIILSVMWSAALPACVAEKLGPFASLSRSAYLTKGNRLRALAITLVVYFVSGVVQGALQVLLPKVGGETIATLGVFLWTALFQAFWSIVVAVLYHDLRVAREGVDIEQIAAVFD